MLTVRSFVLNASSYCAFNKDVFFLSCLVEKATIRPAKSMDSLCSVPVEGEVLQWPLKLAIIAGRPELPHQTCLHKLPGLLVSSHGHAQSPRPIPPWPFLNSRGSHSPCINSPSRVMLFPQPSSNHRWRQQLFYIHTWTQLKGNTWKPRHRKEPATGFCLRTLCLGTYVVCVLNLWDISFLIVMILSRWCHSFINKHW